MHLAALAGVLAMLLFGCLKARSVANALKTDVILLVVASLALGKALVDTGGTAALAQSFVAIVAGWPPLAIVGALLSLVAVLTNFVSNNAAAIGTPIAIEGGAPARRASRSFRAGHPDGPDADLSARLAIRPACALTVNNSTIVRLLLGKRA
jgi:hypothetical protein